jgi:tetratricopeptide (TPR) repeat protein
VCRDELGRVLMAQERWDDAEAGFRQCVAEAPRRSGGHRALAEMLLRRGGDPASALESARQAVAADRGAAARRSALGKEDNAINLGESLAFLAWALAANRADRHEVESTLDEAFRRCGVSTKPVLAELHYSAAQAHLALGNASESRRHFACAAEIDPAGVYGRLSHNALAAVDLPA